MKNQYKSLRHLAFLILLVLTGTSYLQAQTTTDAVCSGSTFDLSVDNSNATTVWQVSNDGTTWTDSAGTQGLSMIAVSPPLSGRFYRALTEDNGCEIASEVMELRASNLSVNLGPDVDVCSGSSVNVAPTVVSEGTPASILWTSADFTFANPNQLNQDLSSLTTGSAILTVSDTNGCSVSDTIVYNAIPIAAPGTLDILYTGDQDTFFVLPTCIDIVNFELWGAPGSAGEDAANTGLAGSGGLGGYAAGDLLRTGPGGDTVWIWLGGPNGFNGGGLEGQTTTAQAGGNGGGATDIRYGGNELSNRIGIAGGGGGGGGAPAGTQLPPFGTGSAGDGGIGGFVLAAGGDSLAFGGSGGNATATGGMSPADGGLGGGDAVAAPGGDGGQNSSACNDGVDGGDAFGSAIENGGAGGGGASGPGASCSGEGAGGGGGGGGLGGGGGGGGQATSGTSSFAGAGGGGGGSSSQGFINGGTVVFPASPNENPQIGWVRITW